MKGVKEGLKWDLRDLAARSRPLTGSEYYLPETIAGP